MVDGFKCTCIGLPAGVWKNNLLLDFGISVSESTGELLHQRREANTEALRFVLFPHADNSHTCAFMGSLHKYFKGVNWGAFTHAELCAALQQISLHYGVTLENAYLHTLEIGVNIPLDFPPKRILQSAICHKGKPFSPMDKRDQQLGIVCEHTDYTVKLYDKGRQAQAVGGGAYILRYELKLKRQRLLAPYHVETLADLQTVENVAPMLTLLVDRLNEIVFFDFGYKADGLSPAQRIGWERYSNPNYWAHLNRKQYYNARKLHQQHTEKYGAVSYQKIVVAKATACWEALVSGKTKTLGQIPQVLETKESTATGTFSTLEYMLEKVPTEGKNKTDVQKTEKRRFCVSCGREITRQKTGSRFCSEREFGKEARKCRNKDSNRRLSLKRKIKKAKENNLPIKLVFVGVTGKMCRRTLNAADVALTRTLLDSVQSLIVVRKKRKRPKATNGANKKPR